MNVFDTSPADWGLLIARACIATPFLVSGLHKAVWYRKAAAEFRDAAVPLIAVTLPATILLHSLGSLCLIADVYTAQVAVALIVFTLLATVKVHGFWRFEGEQRLIQSRIALGNVALIGGLLALSVAQPGGLP